MKTFPSALDVVAALLAVGAATAFVPTSCRIIDHGHVLTHTLPASTTSCFASEVDIEGASASTSSPTFPFSDSQVRFAYDEWRLIYGKGDFDSDRFENFKTNHKTLTISNLKARETASNESRRIPQWMSLNEYGDYSLDEYEAMMRGEQPVVNYDNGQVEEYQDQFGRTVRSTPQASTSNQEESLTSAASSQAINVDSNYANNIDGDDESSRGTLIIPKGEDDNDDNEVSQSVTQIIGTNDANEMSQRGTQVIGTNNANDSGSAVRGTQVILPGGGANGSGVRGTQVLISGNDQSTGTQVLRPSTDPDETEIQPTNDGGTQILPTNDGGTQIIPESDADSDGDGGTISVSKDDKGSFSNIFGNIFGDSENDEDGEDSSDNTGSRGTMVIKRSIEEPEQKSLTNPFSFFGSSSIAKDKEEEEKIEDKTEDEEPSKSNNFFSFLSPKDNSTAIETAVTSIEEEEEIKTGSGIFSLFGGNVKSSNPRTVRTSISLQKQTPKEKKTPGFQRRRKTTLIPEETENENGMPSILSFFGGAKKVDEEEIARDPNSRPTLVVKKPQKFQLWSPFSAEKTEETTAGSASTTNPNDIIAAQIAKQKERTGRAAERQVEVANEREAERLKREQTRIAATQKREALARPKGGTRAIGGAQAVAASEPPKTAISPFSFFGAIGKQAEPPTLKKWRQNRDGTLTGLIYDSKSFKDGTRITTSPVPRGAKMGSVVLTDGGSKYSLT